MAKTPKSAQEQKDAANLDELLSAQSARNELQDLRDFVITRAYRGNATAFASDFMAFRQGGHRSDPAAESEEGRSAGLLGAIFGEPQETDVYNQIRRSLLSKISDRLIELEQFGPEDYHSFDVQKLLYLAVECGLIEQSALINLLGREINIDLLAEFLFEYGIVKEKDFKEILKTRIDLMSVTELRRVAQYAFIAEQVGRAEPAVDATTGWPVAGAKPKTAPRLYAKRPDPEGEDIATFVQDTYGTWLDGKNFTLADLRVLDPQAAAAVDHKRRQGKWPSSVKLPTIPEAHDAILADPMIEDKVREARRLVRLYDSRKAKLV